MSSPSPRSAAFNRDLLAKLERHAEARGELERAAALARNARERLRSPCLPRE